ncbi:MAG: NifB/NifX family molybdenum-iron cluster-binding protein [Velocimicrobium sp.]
MKIAVSTTGQSKESQLDRRFGRCEYFLIYDTETQEYKAVRNNGVSSQGGAGIAAASQVIDENVSVIITGNLGPNAFELIEKAGIEAYSCEVLPAFRAIEMFQKNQLEIISSAGNSHQGMK